MAFNAAAIRRSKQRLEDLGYFSSVAVTPSPRFGAGSQRDRHHRG